MLPVSGALQLNTSGDHGTRPVISASGAYSWLLNPQPPKLSPSAPAVPGMNMFHNPAAFALGFSSSIMAVGVQRRPALVLASTSA